MFIFYTDKCIIVRFSCNDKVIMMNAIDDDKCFHNDERFFGDFIKYISKALNCIGNRLVIL